MKPPNPTASSNQTSSSTPASSSTSTGLLWDEASDPAAVELARAYEVAWQSSKPGRRPDPEPFLGPDHQARPGDLLAVLRTDLTLRRRDREAVDLAAYRDRFPSLHPDAFVALLYEDFCLREEAGETPEASEYEARFPEFAAGLRDLLIIHDLVAEPGSTSTDLTTDLVSFPRSGETIAGFRLVEELGRGSFARVFLASERQLADRSVALKVSRTGSREPQTLARLQHTHIVPVYSYRTDRATGLHLLCMPFFGKVTLARLLAERRSLTRPRTGGDLVAALDRIGDPGSAPNGGTAGPAGVGGAEPCPGAVAWWGARAGRGAATRPRPGGLASRRQAVERPDRRRRDADAAGLQPVARGGDPEASGFRRSWAARSPTWPPSTSRPWARGMMAGSTTGPTSTRWGWSCSRPWAIEADGAVQSASSSLLESLNWLLEHRRTRASPRATTFDRDVRPDPAGSSTRSSAAASPQSREERYASAGDLALDLQAVADDAPLTFRPRADPADPSGAVVPPQPVPPGDRRRRSRWSLPSLLIASLFQRPGRCRSAARRRSARADPRRRKRSAVSPASSTPPRASSTPGDGDGRGARRPGPRQSRDEATRGIRARPGRGRGRPAIRKPADRFFDRGRAASVRPAGLRRRPGRGVALAGSRRSGRFERARRGGDWPDAGPGCLGFLIPVRANPGCSARSTTCCSAGSSPTARDASRDPSRPTGQAARWPISYGDRRSCGSTDLCRPLWQALLRLLARVPTRAGSGLLPARSQRPETIGDGLLPLALSWDC